MHIDRNKQYPEILTELGWDDYFQEHFRAFDMPDFIPARVISESREDFRVYCRYGELMVKISGKMRFESGSESDYPAVGDWVVITKLANEQKGIIREILPRKSKYSREAAGSDNAEQIIAANIDTIFIVSGLDGGRNFNLRRIERYLTLAWSSGSTPVIMLNKTDLCHDVDSYIRKVRDIAPGVDIHPVSAKEKTGLDRLRDYLTRGHTAAFLGTSGVGKSTIINGLLGEEKQSTSEVREDDRAGRHTTTSRELILIPGGGIVIDTPGMRELRMWAGEDDLREAFPDIEELAGKCRFNDCIHNRETGCAVKEVIERGNLDIARLESYRKLQKELDFLASREDNMTRIHEKRKWKKLSKLSKQVKNRL